MKPANLMTRLSTFLISALVFLWPSLGHAAIMDIDGIVRLEWKPSSSADVLGYNIYRSSRPDDGYQQINASPIADTAFFDDSLSDGGTYYYAIAAVDTSGRQSSLAYAPTPVIVELDSDGPVLMQSAPYDGQGYREDANGNGQLDSGEDANGNGLLDHDTGLMPRVPAETAIFARLHDKNAIDPDSLSIVVLVDGVIATGKFQARAVPGTDHREYFVQFLPHSPFPTDAYVVVGVDAADRAGNAMATQGLGFQVESSAMRAAAVASAPQSEITHSLDGMRSLVTNDVELLSRSTEAKAPSLDTAHILLPTLQVDAQSALVAMQPNAMYESPVTMRLTLDGLRSFDAEDLRLLRHDESAETGWTVASVGDGWLESMRVINGGLLEASILEVTVRHSATVAAALATDIPVQ